MLIAFDERWFADTLIGRRAEPLECAFETSAGPSVYRPLAAGRRLRGGRLVWPGSGPEALVEGVRREVSPAGPDDGSGLVIDRDLCEAVRRAGLRKDRPAQAIEDVEFAGQAVGERQAQNAVAHDCDAGDIWCEADHWSGSIS